MWIFRYNMPGYMPEMEPEEYETQDEAKRACIAEILYSADQAESDDIAEELTAQAELANLESGEFSGILADGYYYCVERG